MGCQSAHYSKGFCRKHYLLTRKGREVEIKRDSAQRNRKALKRAKPQKIRQRSGV